MAAPHVAGLAMLLKTKNPDLTQEEVDALVAKIDLPIYTGCVSDDKVPA